MITLFFIQYPFDRGSQGGAIIALAIAAYLAFQHFSRLGNLRKAFDQGSIVATLALITITLIPFFFLFWSYDRRTSPIQLPRSLWQSNKLSPLFVKLG